MIDFFDIVFLQYVQYSYALIFSIIAIFKSYLNDQSILQLVNTAITMQFLKKKNSWNNMHFY